MSADKFRQQQDLDARAASLAAFVAGEVQAPAPREQADGKVAQILFAAREREARRRRVRRTFGASAALGACAAAGLVAWTVANRPPAALSYTVDGVAPPADGYVRPAAARAPEIAFSDGTAIHMMPQASARVLDVGRRGARVMLEDGRAHVHVAHRPGADWQVQAGPFVIHVHGTAFFVEWHADQARLDVQMESGVVSVDGPRASDTVTLKAGQSLSVRAEGSRMVAMAAPTSAPSSAAEPAPVAAAPIEAAPSDAPPPADQKTAPSARPAAGGALPRARWTERLADGEAAAIVAEAQRRGIASVLAGASSEDLAALADAARFRGQEHLARRVLLAQRGRFPGTLRAEEASFLLGRLADGPGGRASDALAWYGRYLREAPSGAYSAEAMGRMMIVLERQQRMDEARAVAAAYLRRFPQGAYARAARAVTSPDR
ncbi:MAG TPA: FecR domain-containing protein [Polyangia bacterium]|nr:FecR domain-containing protein [Polyangia bacterium]